MRSHVQQYRTLETSVASTVGAQVLFVNPKGRVHDNFSHRVPLKHKPSSPQLSRAIAPWGKSMSWNLLQSSLASTGNELSTPTSKRSCLFSLFPAAYCYCCRGCRKMWHIILEIWLNTRGPGIGKRGEYNAARIISGCGALPVPPRRGPLQFSGK